MASAAGTLTLAIALAGWLSAGLGGDSAISIPASMLAAVFGVWCAARFDLMRRIRQIAALGCASGAAAIAGGFLRYATLPAHVDADVSQRVGLCGAVFIGGLIFAGSAVVLGKLHGALDRRRVVSLATAPGFIPINLLALVLCGWLGYGFVTETALAPGLAALLAMSGLAAALGAHLMMAFDDWPPQALTAAALRAERRACASTVHVCAELHETLRAERWAAVEGFRSGHVAVRTTQATWRRRGRFR